MSNVCHEMHEGEILNRKKVVKSPTLLLNNHIFLEGLVQAEVITEAFEKLLEEEKI